MRKISAVLEVFLVTFLIIPLLTLAIYRAFPTFETWQTETLGFPFPVFVYLVMMGVTWLVIRFHGDRPNGYGIHLHGFIRQIDIAGASFIPIIIANFTFGMGIDHTTWGGALVLTAVQLILLFVLGWLLRKKSPAAVVGISASAFLLLPVVGQAVGTKLIQALVMFITYAFFVGFGEEVLYRGYMHSRLQQAFGTPFRFFGVTYGWGAIITAFLFGLTHVHLLSWLLGLSANLTWAWGFWTFFSGLVFGFVRQKSGGVLAPALLHGLPQAIAVTVLLFI